MANHHANIALESMVHEIKKTYFFALIADEINKAHHRNKVQLLCYHYNGNIVLISISFTGNSLVNYIKLLLFSR